MKNHQRSLSFSTVVVAAAMALGLGACPSGEDPSPAPGCMGGGDWHPAGESFPAGDGCNTCSCGADGAVQCTLIACQPMPEPGGCTDGKTQFALGASFPAPDGCNRCECTEGGISCTEINCSPLDKKCVRGGCSGQLCLEEGSNLSSTCEFREEYACFAKAKCERQANGQCGHTPSEALDACLAATGDYCQHNGEWHRVGESFRSTDSCNTCKCEPNGVICSIRACL